MSGTDLHTSMTQQLMDEGQPALNHVQRLLVLRWRKVLINLHQLFTAKHHFQCCGIVNNVL